MREGKSKRWIQGAMFSQTRSDGMGSRCLGGLVIDERLTVLSAFKMKRDFIRANDVGEQVIQSPQTSQIQIS